MSFDPSILSWEKVMMRNVIIAVAIFAAAFAFSGIGAEAQTLKSYNVTKKKPKPNNLALDDVFDPYTGEKSKPKKKVTLKKKKNL